MSGIETEAETPGPRRSIGGLFVKLGRFFVDVILPPTCLACRSPVGEGGGLCPRCWNGAGFNRAALWRAPGHAFPERLWRRAHSARRACRAAGLCASPRG